MQGNSTVHDAAHDRKSYKRPFNLAALRRREIERCARQPGAPKRKHLIAWHWHNRRSRDPVFALTEACRRMRYGKITEADARDIIGQASSMRPCGDADALASFLGVTYALRERLKLTTIGACDVPKQARKELRKRKKRLDAERRRRRKGAKPQAQSLSRTKPWEAKGMSRSAWYRKGGTTSTAPLFLIGGDESVPQPNPVRAKSVSPHGSASRKSAKKAVPSTGVLCCREHISIYGAKGGDMDNERKGKRKAPFPFVIHKRWGPDCPSPAPHRAQRRGYGSLWERP